MDIYALKALSAVTVQIYGQRYQRPYHIIAPRILILTAILTITRLEKDIFSFFLYS